MWQRTIRIFVPHRPSELEAVKPEELTDLAVHAQRCTRRYLVLFDQLYTLRVAVSVLLVLYIVSADWSRATVAQTVLQFFKGIS